MYIYIYTCAYVYRDTSCKYMQIYDICMCRYIHRYIHIDRYVDIQIYVDIILYICVLFVDPSIAKFVGKFLEGQETTTNRDVLCH